MLAVKIGLIGMLLCLAVIYFAYRNYIYRVDFDSIGQ
jgi:cbb3-type cytochrome oxidase subunit 3